MSLLSINILWQKILYLALPSKCISCGIIVDSNGTICGKCWGEISFLTGPSCYKCAQPFEYNITEGTLCGNCIKTKPAYDNSISVMKYDEYSRRLITRFKYADQIQYGSSYAKWMQNYGKQLIKKSDLIVPVPLNWRRRISRRYNQSSILANIIAKESDVAVNNNILLRTRNNTPQASLSLRNRRKNVATAFNINNKNKSAIAGNNILLIDDVMTTGATLHACAKTLKKAGAKEVYTLTLAKRVLD